LIGTSHYISGSYINPTTNPPTWTSGQSILNVSSPSGIAGTGEGVVQFYTCGYPGPLYAIQTGTAKDGIVPFALRTLDNLVGSGEYNCKTGASYMGSLFLPGTAQGMISATPLQLPC
jgi:hypothetical protein